MARLAGIDGCRTGWVVAGDDGSVEVVAALDDVFADIRRGVLDAVAIDVPSGLPEDGRRPCDVAARRLLGPRRSSVFPAPARRFLHATSFADVSGMSLQASHLLRRIAEVDSLIDPVLQDVVVEAHPELAFARIAGAPLEASKRTSGGRTARCRALGLAHVPAHGDHVVSGARLRDH